MKLLYPMVCCALVAAFSCHLQAANNASDIASNYTGLSSYLNTNRGTGWGSAFTASGTSVNAFLGSSPQIDTNGTSFGLSGVVTRSFGSASGVGAGSLNADQFFRFRLQSALPAQGSGFGLLITNVLNSFSSSVSLSYTGGSQNYALGIRYSDPTFPTFQTIDTGVPFSTNALTVTFSQSGNTFSISLTPAGGSTTTLTNSYVGAAGGIQLSSSGSTPLYFNNLEVVPEPGSWMLAGVGLLSLLGLHLKRKQNLV